MEVAVPLVVGGLAGLSVATGVRGGASCAAACRRRSWSRQALETVVREAAA